MKIDNSQIYDLLKNKGISNFYHANTVATAITFIQEGGLLSRGYVESRNLYQTSQSSDKDDIVFDVWNDVFIDIIDLHTRYNRQNFYGPVLFEFNLEFLLNSELDIWVTKNNPIYWRTNFSMSDKYFSDIEELDSTWDYYEIQKRMFTIRKPNKPVLFESLERIIIDDPNVILDESINLKNEVCKALKKATENLPNIRKKMSFRECEFCYCKSNYLNEVTNIEKLFLPSDHSYFVDS